ncbi:hypothetical protein [Erythrobacter sp.]|jgi:hypothetical protein|uniref:hypothetical protein n=1 Tax=Erythrobacter sp. TaxID=1042 RepID=UPI002EBA4221|nr:hypothetical protein [Erythrobacter sp.]
MIEQPDAPPPSQSIVLAAGSQAVINGALVTASDACTLEVGSGAYVFTGRRLWRGDVRNPHEELYFSVLEASRDEDYFGEQRFRLFALLAQVVAQDRSHEAQKECALCASELLTGNSEGATRSAARLAAMRLGAQPGRRSPGLPGRRAERRERVVPPEPLAKACER